jgi:voltage-gated potassium channel
MNQTYEAQQFKGPGYEVFIVSISILAIANLILILFTPNTDMDQVVFIINIVISLFLLSDFFYRLLSSPSKKDYFIKDFGWLDLLGSLPIFGMQLFRLFRIIRVIRLLREMGSRTVSRKFRHERATSAMATVAFLVILVLEFGSYFVVGAENKSADANITTPLDAIWWAFVTITTVGFGDQYPVTDLGRVIGTLVIITGVVLFTVLTGFIATRFFSVNEVNVDKEISPVKSDLESILRILEVQGESLRKLEEEIVTLQMQIGSKNDS